MSAEPRRPADPWSLPARLAAWQAALLGAAFLVAAAFVASVVPYRFWDALDIGSWSRTIAAGGFHEGIYDFQLHRPLFYVAQGLLWRGVGFHEPAGRLLSLSFAVLLAVCVWILAGRLTREPTSRTLVRGLALAVLLSSAVLARYAAAGMTDVPVAALAALTAVFLTSRLGAWRFPLVALASAATVLAKPSGLVALAGLVLAALVLVLDREHRRTGLLGITGVGVGITLALGYDLYEAHRLDEGLADFLSAGANWDYWRIRAATTRTPTLLGGSWLGEAAALLVLHGLVFGVARAAGVRLRSALLVAALAALVWSLGGPMVADGDAPRALQDAPSLLLLAYLVLAVSLVAAPYLGPHDDPVPRRTYVVLLLWAAPGTVTWAAFRTDELRLLSPAWPALVLLAACSLALVVRALSTRSVLAACAAVLASGLVAVTNLAGIDGLERRGWDALLERGPDGWDRASMEAYAWGPFLDEVTPLRGALSPGDRVVTQDGRLRYLFPGQVVVAYPKRCSELAGARAFVLLLDDAAQFVIRSNGGTTSPRTWERCGSPRLTRVAARKGGYVVYLVGPASSG